jgi:membrane fusion protein, multidrug efflux system
MTRSLVLRAALLGALGLAGCGEAAPQPEPVRPVLTIEVIPITKEIFGPFAGTVAARYQTQLGFQTSGRIVARDVYVGDIVAKGQRLAALDPILARLSLTRAKADVVDAKAQLTNAEHVLERQKILAAAQTAPQSDLDNAIAQRDTAKAKLDQSESALRLAEQQMGYTELYANFDGVVSSWSAEIGEFVGEGKTVVTIARPEAREAVVDIPDNLIARVRPGMEFAARLQTSPEIVARALVREIDPLADSLTRAHRVFLTLQDPSPGFRLGTTVTVEIDRSIPPRILIPGNAVVSEAGAKHVWVLAQDRRSVARRAIEVGAVEGEMVAVSSGLAAGDRIVVVGVHSLHDGQEVAGEAAPSDKAGGAKL